MIKTLKSTYRKHLIFVLLPLGMTVVGAAIFHEFVIHSILTNIVINSIIIGAAAFGAMLMLLRLKDIRSEWQVFEQFVSRIQVNQSPISTSHCLVSRLISRIQQIRHSRHASVMEQRQLQEALEHMEHVLDSRQEAAQYVVGLMIALGLLGTFIGLLETLVAVGDLIGGFGKADSSQNMDQALVQLIGTLRYPLTAMGTAFSASMFGLLCSLTLGIMLLSVRAFQVQFMQFARGVTESSIADVISLASVEGGGDETVVLSRMAELQRVQQALQGDVRALASQGLSNEARLSQLLSGMDKYISLNEKAAQNAEAITVHLASLPALIQLTDRLGHSVQQLAGTVMHAQRQSDLQQQSLGQSMISQLTTLGSQVERAYAEHARHTHTIFAEMLEQRLSAIELRSVEADSAQKALLQQHEMFERICNVISEASALTASMMQHQQAASETHTQALHDLRKVIVDAENQSITNSEKIQASLSNSRSDQAAAEIAHEISRGFERMESEFRVGLGAVLALHRQAIRDHADGNPIAKEMH